MALNESSSTSVESLLKAMPVDTPSSVIERSGDRTVITIEGRPSPRLPSGVITALVVFAISAFICPGIGLIAVLILPVGLLILGGIYLLNPEILEQPVDTQALVIAPREIRFYEACPRQFTLRDDDDDALPPTATINRTSMPPPTLHIPNSDDEEQTGIAFGDSSEEQFVFADFLVPQPTGGQCDDDADDERTKSIEELKWLHAVIMACLADAEN